MTAALLLTCEHAGNRVPDRWKHRFIGRREELDSHRGWDPGAHAVARLLSRLLDAPLRAHEWTRLLADTNRAEGNPSVFGPPVRTLPTAEKRMILERYHRPHRERVFRDVEEHVMAGRSVIHVGIHSFTPVLEGRRRSTGIGVLYDPSRSTERTLATCWASALRRTVCDVNVHRNRPYRGTSDGLPTWLRDRFGPDEYLGLELEISTALLSPKGIDAFAHSLGETVASTLEGCLPAVRATQARTASSGADGGQNGQISGTSKPTATSTASVRGPPRRR